MSLIRLAVIAAAVSVAVWAAIPYVDSPEHRADTMARLKRTVTRAPEPPRTVTVYQSTGSKGEAVFADARHDQGRGQARVVDNSKGNSFHAAAPVHDDDDQQGTYIGPPSSRHYAQGNDPIAQMQREQLRLQQHVADIKQKQIDRLSGQ